MASLGALPLENQLDRSYQMQYELDGNGSPKYYFGEAMSIGQSYDAAKMQAQQLALLNLAGSIQDEVTSIVQNSLANEQLSPNEANSIVKTITEAKTLISQKIGRSQAVVEAYRDVINGNKEVLVRLAYNSDMAKAVAKEVLRERLSKEGDELRKKLDQIMGW